MAIALDKLSNPDLERYLHMQALVAGQGDEAARVLALRAYYDGDHPVLLTDRQKEYLGGLLAQHDFGFAHNLVRSVVDTLRERLSVTGIAIEGAGGETNTPAAQVSAALWQWWTRGRLDSEQVRLYRRALRDGRVYVMVDYDPVAGRPRFTQHHVDAGETEPGVLLHRDPTDENRVLYATRYFRTFDPLTPGATGARRKTVYLPDQIRKYRMGRGGWEPTMDEGDASWPLPWRGRRGQPLGVAVVEFANPGGSEIAQIIALQNALNKAWLDLLAAADTSGFPLIAIEYQDDLPLGALAETDADGEDVTLRLSPGRAIEVVKARVHRLEAAQLEPMIATIRYIVQAISGVSRTPAYYLEPVGGSSVPSGEALKQLESGLVRRAEERQLVFGQTWEDVFALAYRVNQAFGPSLPELPDLALRVEWADANVRNENNEAAVAEAHQRLGVPQEELWRRMGYTPEQVQAFKSAQRADDAAKVATVAAALRVGGARNIAPNGNSNGNSNGEGSYVTGGNNGRANQIVEGR